MILANRPGQKPEVKLAVLLIAALYLQEQMIKISTGGGGLTSPAYTNENNPPNSSIDGKTSYQAELRN